MIPHALPNVQVLPPHFIRADRRAGAVPGAPVWIELLVGGVGQRLMHLPPFRGGRGTVDGRTNQGMPEFDTIAQLDQGRRLGGGGRVDPDAQPLRGAQQIMAATQSI